MQQQIDVNTLDLQQIKVSARTIIRALQQYLNLNPQIVFTVDHLHEFIINTDVYINAKETLLHHLSLHTISTIQLDKIVQESLLKIESNVANNIWAHEYYRSSKDLLYLRIVYKLNIDTITSELELYETIINIYNELISNLMLKDIYSSDPDEIYSAISAVEGSEIKEVWSEDVTSSAMALQEKIHNNPLHKNYGIDMVGMTGSGFINMADIVLSVLKLLHDAKSKGASPEELDQLEKKCISTFTKEANVNVSNVALNRSLTLDHEGRYDPHAKVSNNIGQALTTGCIALIANHFLLEAYHDLVKFIKIKTIEWKQQISNES